MTSNQRASTSFTPAELDALDTILAIVRRGGDATIVARQPAAVSLARKIANMRTAVERARHGPLTGGGDA